MPSDAPKPSPIMFLHHVINGGIVNNAEMALKIATIILENHYGADAAERQKPLSVRDLSDRWVIEGNANRPRKPYDRGIARVEILKEDGRVLDAAIPTTFPAPPELAEKLKKMKEGDN